VWGEEATDMADGMPQLVDGPDGLCAKQGFELGEGHFDGVEIGAVGRQEEDPCSSVADELFHERALVSGQVVHDDDIALVQGWSQMGLDIGLEDRPVDRRVDDEGGSESCRCLVPAFSGAGLG